MSENPAIDELGKFRSQKTMLGHVWSYWIFTVTDPGSKWCHTRHRSIKLSYINAYWHQKKWMFGFRRFRTWKPLFLGQSLLIFVSVLMPLSVTSHMIPWSHGVFKEHAVEAALPIKQQHWILGSFVLIMSLQVTFFLPNSIRVVF